MLDPQVNGRLPVDQYLPVHSWIQQLTGGCWIINRSYLRTHPHKDCIVWRMSQDLFNPQHLKCLVLWVHNGGPRDKSTIMEKNPGKFTTFYFLDSSFLSFGRWNGGHQGNHSTIIPKDVSSIQDGIKDKDSTASRIEAWTPLTCQFNPGCRMTHYHEIPGFINLWWSSTSRPSVYKSQDWQLPIRFLPHGNRMLSIQVILC